MRALVISGGGCKGAFAGGIAEYLIKECCTNYDLYVGCSTGSLLLPHLALGKIEKIKSIFTSVSQNDIFSISPFKKKKTKTGSIYKINHLNMIYTFIKGCPTFGESNNLRKLIKNSLTVEEFDALNTLNKKLIVTVSNLTKNSKEFKQADQCSYEDFCDWAWASCNYIPFMSLFTKDGCQYADGGFGGISPIWCAIENGACEIDVIILKEENKEIINPFIKNQFTLLLRTFQFMDSINNNKDILIGKLAGINKKININYYYTPRQLTENPLWFDPDQMKQWWEEGFEYAKSKKPISHCFHPVMA